MRWRGAALLRNWIEGESTPIRRIRFVPSIAATLLTAVSASAGDPPPAPQPPEAVKALALDVLKSLVETNTTHAQGSTRAGGSRGGALARGRISPRGSDTDRTARSNQQGQSDHPAARQGRAGRCCSSVFWTSWNPRGEGWSVDPFPFTAKDGYLRARHVRDIKGDDAALVASVFVSELLKGWYRS